MKSNVALVGFMGTGKTATGQELAKRLGWKFIEVDALIEGMAGKSIPEIFAEDGEIAFREKEIEAVKTAAEGKRQVIACGGGVVLNTINIARLKETSVMVLLTASLAAILKRTAPALKTRPMLTDTIDPGVRIKELLKYRRPYYERSAEIIVNTSKLSLTAVVDEIIEKLKDYEGLDIKK
jgi:shikimate kinase